MIEWSITAGGLLNLLTVILGIGGLYYGIVNKVELIKYDVGHLKKSNEALTEAFKQLGNILVKIAVQDERIQQVEHMLDEMVKVWLANNGPSQEV